jgi:uncharacterized membrane protein
MTDDASFDPENVEPVALPINGELDLHTFRPKEVKTLVHDYLDECQKQGVYEIRIVHGKGDGTLRRVVEAQLARRDDVLERRLAPRERGGWGATLVTLAPAHVVKERAARAAEKAAEKATMQEAQPAPRSSLRLAPLDAMRGLVMLLMTVDHASEYFNEGRYFSDGAMFWKAGSAIPVDQFLFRFITHLCAPTFVFLAGVGIALSTQKRLAQGESAQSVDKALFTRGLFIALLDPLWMSLPMLEGTGVLFQVLYAIGISMMCMPLLRKLSPRALGVTALSFFALSELLTGLSVMASGGAPSIVSALTLSGGIFPIEGMGSFVRFIVGYPFVHWLAIMLLGYACAERLARSGIETEQWLLKCAAGLFALFGVVRGLNAYGNMGLLRDSAELVQWLHVSKYPPSITFIALELGIMALWLAAFYRLGRAGVLDNALAPLVLLGQTALFYYVLHVHVLFALSHGFGIEKQSMGLATLMAAGDAVFLYFVCRPYARHKSAHPNGWARWL